LQRTPQNVTSLSNFKW